MAQGAYPPNTVRAWRADWRSFTFFCSANGESPLPASPNTVRSYVQYCMAEVKKPATIRRHLATIARAHRAAELLSPCASEPVRLALKEMSRAQPARQRQARPLGWSEIKQFLETAGRGIRADRERALLCVAYDSMARRSELVALDVSSYGGPKPIRSGRALGRTSRGRRCGTCSFGSRRGTLPRGRCFAGWWAESKSGRGCMPIWSLTSLKGWGGGSSYPRRMWRVLVGIPSGSAPHRTYWCSISILLPSCRLDDGNQCICRCGMAKTCSQLEVVCRERPENRGGKSRDKKRGFRSALFSFSSNRSKWRHYGGDYEQNTSI
jgi:hypothetical protein